MTRAQEQFDPRRNLAYLDRIVEARAGGIPIPPVVEVYPSASCPHNCPTCCSKETMERFSGSIETDIIIETITQLAGWRLDSRSAQRVVRIEFSGGGEPTSHPRLADMMKHAHGAGLEVGLITNGHFLSDDLLRSVLVETCSFVRVALDAATSRTYFAVHRSLLPFDELCRSLSRLVEDRRVALHRGHSVGAIGAKFLVTSKNYGEALSAARLAKNLGVDYIEYKPVRGIREQVSEVELRQARGLIREASDELNDGTFLVEDRCERIPPNKRCYLTPLHPVIGSDGSVYLCSYMQERYQTHCIGNIYETPFRAIWGSETHKRAINAIDPCYCSLWDCPLERDRLFIEGVLGEGSDLPQLASLGAPFTSVVL